MLQSQYLTLCRNALLSILELYIWKPRQPVLDAWDSRSTNFRLADHTSLLSLEQVKQGWKSAQHFFIFRQVTQALSSSPSLRSQTQWLGGWLPEPLSLLVHKHQTELAPYKQCNGSHKLPAGSTHSSSWLDSSITTKLWLIWETHIEFCCTKLGTT